MTNKTSRSEANSWLAALACMLAGAAVFQFFGNSTFGYIRSASLFWWWISQWLEPAAETQHGWLVLALSVGLLSWRLRRVESSELRVESSSGAGFQPAGKADGGLEAGATWPAVAAMLAGLVLHALGFVAQQARVSIVAFLIFTWGALRLGGGKKWGAAALFPVGFMVFAIPINVLDSLGFWLQMGVVRATAWIVQGVGIEVVRNGTQLFAPDGRYQYDVVAACSGVRSLVAMTALSVLAGYLSFRGWLRRGVVLLSCFPLVYLGNVVRLVTIVVAAEIGGQRWGDIAHRVMGAGVFAIVLGGVLAAVLAMERWWPEKKVPNAECRMPNCDPSNSAFGTRRSAFLIAASVVALAVGEMFFLHQFANSPPRGGAGVALAADGVNPVELPAFIGTEWVGRRTEITAIEREILPADTGYSRKLYVPIGDPAKHVLLSVVLSGRDRTSIHRPELCLVGQGWTIGGQAAVRFRHPKNDADFPATLLRVRREVTTSATVGKPRGAIVVPQLVVYWFVSADRVVATHWERVARDAWNRVAHARADRWAYVLMQTDATDGEEAAIARMQAVLDGALPVFQPRP